jgi:hypothetical protein
MAGNVVGDDGSSLCMPVFGALRMVKMKAILKGADVYFRR